jgi:multidrug resistance efflux pump
MGLATIPLDEEHAEQALRQLEHRYRASLNRLTSARASYQSLSELTDADENEVRGSLLRVQRLQAQLAEVQTAMELIEDGVYS